MKKFLVLATSALLVLTVFIFGRLSAQPAWWTANGTAFIDANATANNYAPLNVGQLKNVALSANLYFNSTLGSVGGEGAAIDSLVGNFSVNGTLGYQPANLGQLKAVGQPFYDRLLAIGYNTRANLIANGYPATWLYDYPWNPTTPTAQNYAPANLGQLKMVFSFDLSSFTVGTDADSDGLVSGVEAFRGTNPSVTDTDGDGTNDGSDAVPLDPAFNSIPILYIGDTSFPNITLSDPSGAVLVTHVP